MAAMNFSKTFIEWILLMHRDVKTKLLLNFISDPITILFSILQGNQLSMILFFLYIEPLLLYLIRTIKGYALKSPVVGGDKRVEKLCLTEKLKAYVDDSNLLITSEEEFVAVDEAVHKFEKLSGAIPNRSIKSMGLGRWK